MIRSVFAPRQHMDQQIKAAPETWLSRADLLPE
jgi:hypothetical protein